MILKLALRNVWRHKRRSAITGAAIAMGLGMLIISSGSSEGITSSMIRKGTGSAAGTVVIQGVGWQDERKVEMVVADSTAVAGQLAQTLPDATITRRIFLRGLLTSPSGSSAVAVTAVEPGPEAVVNDLANKLVEGVYLDGSPDGIVLGSGLAESLDVGLGDKVVLMAKGRGEMASRLFRVSGLFTTGLDDIDGFCGQVTLGAAQEMLGLDDGANQVAAHLPASRRSQSAKAEVQATFPGDDVEVLAWEEALPQLAEYAAYYRTQIYIMFAVMFTMVALGIVNTVLMSVLERMREFGVLLSLGASPQSLALLVVTESALLGVVSVAAGTMYGLLVNWPLQVYGWDISDFFGGKTVEIAGFAMETYVQSDLDPSKVVMFAALAFLVTVAAAVYPAYKAATLLPVECLQHR